MTSLLTNLGHEVQAAQDGHAGVERARDFRPHLILVDMGLPGMNGYETARRLRRTPEGQHAKIVAVSGYGLEEDSRLSREAGIDNHLVKPVDLESLLRLLGSVA